MDSKNNILINDVGRWVVGKKKILFLAFILMTNLIHAQYSLGTTGQLMIPTAEMQETGTFVGGVNYLPENVTPSVFSYPTMNYFVDMTLFSFVEFTYRMTLLKMHTPSGKVGYYNQDRSNTIRIRPVKERRFCPAIVIGADDFLTEGATPYWGSYYGVLTKTIGLFGKHQLAVTAGWYFHQGNRPIYNEGFFGGVRYTPAFCPEMKMMVEYDTHGWNLGAAVRFWKHVSVNVFTRDFNCVAAGIRYECTLIH